MIQQTSTMALHELKDLGHRQYDVYVAIQRLSGATIKEISDYVHKTPNEVSPRVNELRQLGYIREGSRRKDKITGKLAIEWKVRTNNSQLELF